MMSGRKTVPVVHAPHALDSLQPYCRDYGWKSNGYVIATLGIAITCTGCKRKLAQNAQYANKLRAVGVV